MTASAQPVGGARLVTVAKVRIYEAHGGDIDAWARRGHDAAMSDADWHLIESLRQDLCLVCAGRASPAFAEATERRLQAATDSDETRHVLRELARPDAV